MREGGLVTICEEARCPNIGECWGRGTATFQILGDTCTRACRYCYVHSGKPDGPPDPLEPLRLAQAAAQMKLSHVVVTSVDRDDLPDRGAAHYAATIRAIKRKLPDAKVEILTPDFLGAEEEALATVLAARPEVFNHNIETVRRLHPRMRGAKASYEKALWLLERAKKVAGYPVLTKSGIIVGLGEMNDEVVETMHDLRSHGVDVVTIGQYLQPSPKHATDRPLGASRRVPLVPRAGRGARVRVGVLRPARTLVVSRGRAAPRGGNRTRRRRVLSDVGVRAAFAVVAAAVGSRDGDRSAFGGGAAARPRVRVPSGAQPHDVAPARDGGVWLHGASPGELGWLDPKTGQTRLRLGSGSAPHGVIVGPGRRGVDHRRRAQRDRARRPAHAARSAASRCRAQRYANLNTATFDREASSGSPGRAASTAGSIRARQGHVFSAPRGAGPYGITTTPAARSTTRRSPAATSRRIDVRTGRRRVIEPPTPARVRAASWSDSRGPDLGQRMERRQGRHVRPRHAALARMAAARAEPAWRMRSTSTSATRSGSPTSAPTRSSASTRPTRSSRASDCRAPAPNVRQILGRPGEVWGAESGTDKLVVVATR